VLRLGLHPSRPHLNHSLASGPDFGVHLNLARDRRVSGFCSSGLVVFGYRWTGGQSVDLSQSVEHEKLIALVVSYGVHAYTLELAAKLDVAGRAGNQAEYNRLSRLLLKWLKDHPQDYQLLHHYADDIKDFEAVAVPIAKEFVGGIPCIHNLLVNLENRVFVFQPSLEGPAAGWREFFDFADGFSRFPLPIINDLGGYFFEARLPSTSGS